MEFKISKQALQKELGFVQGVVEKKGNIPALSNLLLETPDKETLLITATDLDITMRCRAEANVIAPGTACVQAKKFFDIVRYLPDEDVHFRAEDNDRSSVSCQNFTSKIMGIPRSSFPDIPSFKETSRQMPASIFKQVVETTIYAITQEESRYQLSGAKFIFNHAGVTMVATDGHRLAYIQKHTNGNAPEARPIDLLIPRKALVEMKKIAADFDGNIAMGADDNHLYFQTGRREIVSRLLTGTFPNYEMVIPTSYVGRATFEGKDLITALRRVALMVEERSQAVVLTLMDGQMKIDARNNEDGEATETIRINYTGEELVFGYNAMYLKDFLEIMKDGRIAFEFRDGNSQGLFYPEAVAEGEVIKQVVMPMRV